MKKNYVSPLMLEVNVEAEQMLANSLRTSNRTIDTSVSGSQLSDERRGSWGDLWQ